MSRTTSVTIGEPLNAFIAEMIASGRYGSTSEVVRSALRVLELEEKKMKALKMAIEAGEKSGESTETLQSIAAEVKRQYNV